MLVKSAWAAVVMAFAGWKVAHQTAKPIEQPFGEITIMRSSDRLADIRDDRRRDGVGMTAGANLK